MNKFEREIADVFKKAGFKAKVQAGSGAGSFDKADVKLEGYLVEVKSTTKRSMSVKLEWLLKTKSHAERIAKDPALVLDFRGGIIKERWVCVPLDVFIKLIGKGDD